MTTRITHVNGQSGKTTVLCRLKEKGVELIGLHYFVQQLIQAAENE